MSSFRRVFLIGFLVCLSMLLVAAYFQFVEHMEPCPLCILQRVMVLAVAVIFLLGFLHNPASIGRKAYGGMIFILALIGAGISGHHVWLQSLPPEDVPTCGPGLNFILDTYPITQALEMIFRGSGECAEVLWTFLGLSIPAWTLIAFAIIAWVGLLQMIKSYKPRALFQ